MLKTILKILFLLLLSIGIFYPDNSIAIYNDSSCSKYGITVRFNDSFTVKRYERKTLACIAINDSIQLNYYVFHAGKGKTLNLKNIQKEFFKVTGALQYPQPFFDKIHLFSSINFLLTNEVVPELFINGNRKKGFYFHAASEKTAAFIAFDSAKPLNNDEIFKLFDISRTSVSKLYKVWVGTLIILPIILFLLLTIPSKLKRSFWRNIDLMRAYGINAVFSIILLPAAILLAFWGFGFQTEGFSVAITATVLVLMIITRSVYRYFNKPNLLFKLNDIPKLLFTSYSRESTTKVMDAPVHTSHSQHITMWVAHPQKCKNCNSQYVIYTPSREERSSGSWNKPDLSKSDVESMLESAVKKTQPPINGCPKCHSTDHISQEVMHDYLKKTNKDNWYAVAFLIVGSLGTYLLYFLTSNDIIKSGMLVDSIKFVKNWIPFTFQDIFIIGASIILSSLYASYKLFFRKQGYGLWGCSKDDYIFENINPSSELEQICPSCNEKMLPIKDIKIK